MISLNNFPPVQSISSPSVPMHLPRAPQAGNLRILHFMGHAIQMLDHLKKQNQTLIEAEKVNQIYKKAEEEIYHINARLLGQIAQPRAQRVKESNELQNKLKKAEEKQKANQEKVTSLTNALQEARMEEEPSINKIITLTQQLEKHKTETPKIQEEVALLHQQLEDVQLNLSQKEIKNLTEHLKSAEKEIAKLIYNTQIEVAKSISESYVEGAGNHVETLIKGGIGAKWIHLLAWISTHQHNIIEAFKASQGLMEAASRKDLPELGEISTTHVEDDKQAEFARYQEGGTLDRRAGVIGINGIYRFQALFSEKEVLKQFKSFVAQNISQYERTTLERQMEINGKSFGSQFVPLNKEFDKQTGLAKTVAVFTRIFGTKGISSVNRQEPHLINGWESNLHYEGKTIFRALRHAITSDKYEKDPLVRQENSKKAAEELLKAALLQEIASQGLTLEQAKAKKIQLNFNSVSLVSPDDLRPLLNSARTVAPFLPKQNDEKKMLLDQILALRSFQKDEIILELDGIKIPVKVNVQAFNFGVNVGAKLGAENQYQHNVEAMKGFLQQFERFNGEVKKELDRLYAQHTPLLNTRENELMRAHLAQKIDDLTKLKESARLLMLDIQHLMADKKAYLAGDNQYEIGAKILNLSNVMDQAIKITNKSRVPERSIDGFQCAFNCMSGKDRTGIMDVVAKTFAIMAETNDGIYPSHQQLQEDSKIREQFVQTLQIVLLKSGNLEITELNTNAKGFKVGSEARLLGLPIETFLQAQGLSSTTSS